MAATTAAAGKMPMNSTETSPINSLVRLVIEVYDQVTECILKTVDLKVDDIHELLNLFSWEDFIVNASYVLDRRHIVLLNERFGCQLNPEAFRVEIRYRSRLDELPYQVHTGRELTLMLAKQKPLSVFTGSFPPCLDFEEIPERLFDPYVVTGLFVKTERIDSLGPGEARSIRRVLYALPNEVWRINAFGLLLDTARITGWNATLERMEGTLLGYTDEQNDIYFKLFR